MLVAGQVYRTTYTVYDQDTAPSTVALAITKPDGTTLTPAPSVGAPAQDGRDYTYSYDYTLTAGLQGFTWTTQGPGTGRPTDWIRADVFRSILSLAEAREYLDLRDTSRDSVLLGVLAAVTRLIERHIGTCIIRQVTNEWIPGGTRELIRLPSGPVPTDTSVTSIASVWAGGPSWAAADLIVNPDAGTVLAADGQGFWGGPWKATYTAGRAEIPPDVIEGAKAALFDLWATQRGVSTDSAEPGMEDVAAYETIVPPSWRLPPRVLELIDGEHMPGFA